MAKKEETPVVITQTLDEFLREDRTLSGEVKGAFEHIARQNGWIGPRSNTEWQELVQQILNTPA